MSSRMEHGRSDTGPETDLSGIGAPATRALAAAGITTLDQVARLGESGLLALHGVGPKAVRILRERLEAHGKSLPAG